LPPARGRADVPTMQLDPRVSVFVYGVVRKANYQLRLLTLKPQEPKEHE